MGAHRADDVARLLAGLPARQSSVFRELDSDPAWSRHRAGFDADWKSLATGRMPRMKQFHAARLADFRDARVFYPFGGPDALTVTTLFPAANSYLMVGLEPAGTLPDPEKLDPAKLDEELTAFRESLRTVIRTSFFYTKEMDESYRGKVTDGLLPTLLIFLVRLNNEITDLKYVRVDPEGKLRERAPGERPPGRAGVEVRFRTPGGEQRTLRYFSVNLINRHFDENQDFRKYLVSQGRVVTFLKATSYLVHRNSFSMIRDHILQNSDAILQDDSGVPYRLLDPALWTVQLFGRYTPPKTVFANREQPDLLEAYGTPGAATPLGFRIGYGASRGESNLLLARRKKT
ncbi:MAG: hypothetical protein K2X35_18500 [Bryobacteraceae bacterium]|nr:hypothetical protein [Bryobacteraceae bacterium]